MPEGEGAANESRRSQKMKFRDRLLVMLPRVGTRRDKPPLGERLRGAILKPDEPEKSRTKQADAPHSVAELETAVRRADDKERLVGLFAAPFAAAIGILLISALISNNPPALLPNGHANKLHVNPSLYLELEAVLIGLALLMLLTALLRKRLYLGMVAALYGLAVFNLRYWGFGLPFVMVGAWLLVRSFRLNRQLREARGDLPPRGSARPPSARPSSQRPRRANKRYTPPA